MRQTKGSGTCFGFEVWPGASVRRPKNEPGSACERLRFCTQYVAVRTIGSSDRTMADPSAGGKLGARHAAGRSTAAAPH